MKYVATVKSIYLLGVDSFKVLFDSERGAFVADLGEEYFIQEHRFDDLETGIARDATDDQLADLVQRLYLNHDDDEFQLVDCIGSTPLPKHACRKPPSRATTPPRSPIARRKPPDKEILPVNKYYAYHDLDSSKVHEMVTASHLPVTTWNVEDDGDGGFYHTFIVNGESLRFSERDEVGAGICVNPTYSVIAGHEPGGMYCVEAGVPYWEFMGDCLRQLTSAENLCMRIIFACGRKSVCPMRRIAP